ncbi:potassium channel family protein [Dehalococcoidia bacterium]|nr:potassium channel family protein [Dehalococcoidia bacterium]
MGNALTFYFFDRSTKPELSVADAFWYSIISIATIGYGDLSSTSLGARIGTAFFIVFVGLAAFTSAVGIGIDWLLEFRDKERTGMGSPRVKNHLLIINFPNERRVQQIVEGYLQDPGHRKDEIVIVTDQIESLPFTHPGVSFVRGSPLAEQTYQRANVRDARQAMVLTTGYDDPNSDSIAASVVSILEHLNPGIRSVAEVVNTDHSLLFRDMKNVSLVYTFLMSNNLLVQEIQDAGVHMLTHAITSNLIEGTLVSTKVEGGVDQSLPYVGAAKRLLDHEVNLVGVIRGDQVYVRFDGIYLTENDRMVSICSARHDWTTIRSMLGL